MRILRSSTLAAVALLLTVSLAGCGADGAMAPARAARADLALSVDGVPVSPYPEPLIRRALETAAAGLLYTSESDYPFTWFAAPAAAALPLSPESMRAIVGATADAPAEVISLDDFFARHIEWVDPYDSVALSLVPRYVALRETLRRTIPSVRVYRIGAIQVHCYAVGLDREGRVVGLETIAIET